MVLKKEKEYGDGPVPLDESWWNAILEDVETIFTSENQNINVEDSSSSKTDISEKDELNWDWIKNLYDQDQVIQLDVTDHNRGGLLVSGDGIRGFVPASHLINISRKTIQKDRESILTPYLGRTLQLKVIECDADQGRIVLSERAAQSDPGKRHELLNTLTQGDCISGKVTTVTDFGVFVDLGGVEGLIHISELSWGRVCHPSAFVTPGDEVEVCVLKVDCDRNRVALSIKRLVPNPWESIETRYQPGQITDAVVTNIVSYGVFARLEDGLDGLIHISEFNREQGDTAIKNLLSEGQKIEVCIINIDSERQRLGLRMHNGGNGAS